MTNSTPDLKSYDVILVNTSGGKDSQTMLRCVYDLALELGIADRVQAVHADLGRVEWQGTKELAAKQCDFYGVPMHIVKRPQGDLLDHVEQRRMWPSNQTRYCTSDHKRGQVAKVITQLHRDWLAAGNSGTFRVLNCMGLRAEESPARSKKPVFAADKRNTTKTRTVDTWLPIHDWSTEQVWSDIHTSGVSYHRAYDLGMPRLSCCFCIFAPKKALVIAGQHNPELLQQYVDVENLIGHTFRKELSLVQIQAAVVAGDVPTGGIEWAQCY